MLGEVPEGHVAVYACDQDVSAHLGELSVSSLKTRGVAGCVVDGGAKPVRTWRVREGDSLRRIAKRVYGDEALWKAIRDANPGKVGPDGAVRAGVELSIPFDGI